MIWFMSVSPRTVSVTVIGSPTCTTDRSAATSIEKPVPTAPAKLGGLPAIDAEGEETGSTQDVGEGSDPLAEVLQAEVLIGGAGNQRSKVQARFSHPIFPMDAFTSATLLSATSLDKSINIAKSL